MISNASPLDLGVVLLSVSRPLISGVRIANKTVSHSSLLTSSIASLNWLIDSTKVLINIFRTLTHVLSKLPSNIEVSAYVNLLLLALLASRLRLVLPQHGSLIVSLRLRSSESSMVGSLGSLAATGVHIA